jgi:alpha-L-fucosidase
MAAVVDATFAKDLAAAATFTADSSNPANPPGLLHDGSLDTWWEAAPGRTRATVTLTLPVATTFDVVSLQEAVDHRSQRIESVVVETWDGSSWRAPPTVDTLDGTPPTARSPVYDGPVALPDGGTLQAAVLTPEGRLGLVAIKTVVGLAPTGWTARRTSGNGAGSPGFDADGAIDADAATLWKARASEDGVPPSLTVDMGRTRRIGGFAYLARQDWVFEGFVDRYRFETSLDGTHWTTRVRSRTFDNIRNNPSLRQVTFAPVAARFFRFIALRDVEQGGWATVAEITVLRATGPPSADD